MGGAGAMATWLLPWQRLWLLHRTKQTKLDFFIDISDIAGIMTVNSQLH